MNCWACWYSASSIDSVKYLDHLKLFISFGEISAKCWEYCRKNVLEAVWKNRSDCQLTTVECGKHFISSMLKLLQCGEGCLRINRSIITWGGGSSVWNIKQEDLLDLITALLKFNCFLSTTVTMQCTFQSSPWWFIDYCRCHITWSTQTVLLHHQSYS